ncbi:uncharacterized protein LOC107434719 [Ziziphus jujuba]|uniref:Uncharacterized protein LOC107434719 n=1 Tax=Ziziphus jujuba TaxID=326968 RepID=A0A6P4AZP1_ZIZJJ|nr:uncharacterized protein LOC107434719 [Ziziphus jujuba]
MDDYCKRSGQIPAFGDWDYANELPITQYFESARQAGLIRYSSSSGESDQYLKADLYAVDLHNPYQPYRPAVPHPTRKTRGREKRGCSHQQPHVKEHKKQQSVNKVFDVTEPPRKLCHQQHKQPHRHDTVPRPPRLTTTRPPKPVDEDLYKIPPELLRNTKRKKMLGIFSRCLVPACSA